MRTLGLSFDFHDASAALVDHNVLVASVAEERFTLQKHDPNYPAHAINAVMSFASAETPDVVAFYERPQDKFTRVLHASYSDFPRGATRFTDTMKKWLGTTLWTRNMVASRLDIDPRKLVFFPHHQSHIAQAFSTSPFDEAAILVVDGVGEWACTTLASATRNGGIRIIEQHDYPASIGLCYAAFTAFLGFKPNSGEANTMALAAFGRSVYVQEIQKVLRTNSDGTYEVCTDYLDFLADGSERLFKPAFRSLFGEPRSSTLGTYDFDALRDEPSNAPAPDQHYADIAASVQVVLNDTLIGLCRRLLRSTGMSNLCFAGGVALNCVANTEILKQSGFKRFYIPSDPGDGGAAAGAAALAQGLLDANPRATAYLGPAAEPNAIHALLDAPYLHSLIAENRIAGIECPDALTIDRVDLGKLPDLVADRLARGAIVGWVQGRLESGPRALGNRSLLVDPANLDAVRRMSKTVKSHSSYRPYALSIAGEAASDILVCSSVDQPVLRWMQTVWPVRDGVRDRLRGGVHVDGTTRPQLCWRDDNPLYWDLLNAFGRRSGLPVLLNTSFNERSRPLVATAVEALVTFLRTGIDMLVVEDIVLTKVNRQ